MAAKVRFKRDWDFWVSPTVVVMHRKGEEKRLPQAQADAALADKAAELIDPKSPPESDDDKGSSSTSEDK